MTSKAVRAALRRAALRMPEARADSPWPGEEAYKVGKKVFVFSGEDKEGTFVLSLKLPRSGHVALKMKGAEPTGYGLGKSGWVSFREGLDKDLLAAWVEESYRAVAPKKLVKLLDGAADA